jgi:BirA family biotin operon repressor/biotin-[acetyl-CoA-carboxylase] ligase
MFKELHFSEIDSTHLYAKKHLEELFNAYTLITASRQTSGIGRKGDAWISRGENLLATFVFPLPKHDIQNLGQLLAFSVIKILEKFALEPKFKWPNDILINYRKVAGILTEVHEQMVILSIGLNVNMDKDILDDIKTPATSLSNELRHVQSLKSLKSEVNKKFFSDLEQFKISGFKPFYPAFHAKLAFIGKIAKCSQGIGKIDSLLPDGRLLLKNESRDIIVSESSIEII